MKEVRKKENARGANEVEKDTVTKKEERRAEKNGKKRERGIDGKGERENSFKGRGGGQKRLINRME